MKRCRRCKEEKPETEFYKNRANKDGLQYYCKACCKQNFYDWAKKNPEKHAANCRRYYHKRKEKGNDQG